MDTTVAYQGVPGSFSEQALLQFFTNPVQTTYVTTFAEVFKLLNNQEVDYGVLPIENSSTGGIYEILDSLNMYDLYIVGETYVRVTHHLLGCHEATIDTIQEIYSHPQGFQQSRLFLDKFPQWKHIPYYNTAISAQLIAEEQDPKKAAIASKRAAEIYNLKVVVENIQDVNNNYTRFVIISKHMHQDAAYNKISIVYSLPHSVGSLYQSLGIFAEHQVNILSLQSRPIKERPWEFYFYLDLAGNIEDQNVKAALLQIKELSRQYKLLGNYLASDNTGKLDV